jgi:hypothetical protein
LHLRVEFKQLYDYVNSGKKLVLITKHEGDISKALKFYRLTDLFDEIIQLNDEQKKSDWIESNSSIFIDDSHRERVEVHQALGIPVYSHEMIV